MSIFAELETQYNEIDNAYASKEFEAISTGWNNKEAKYRKKRELNDQAYFLCMFSRLEEPVREHSTKLIQKQQRDIKAWRKRAAWDILPASPQDDFPFKKRLALLTEKGANDLSLIVRYYKERNSIAHGSLFTTPISMPTVILELKRLF